VLSVDKKWVVGGSPRQAFSCISWLKNLEIALRIVYTFLQPEEKGSMRQFQRGKVKNEYFSSSADR
jgi:hypothetical protein